MDGLVIQLHGRKDRVLSPKVGKVRKVSKDGMSVKKHVISTRYEEKTCTPYIVRYAWRTSFLTMFEMTYFLPLPPPVISTRNEEKSCTTCTVRHACCTSFFAALKRQFLAPARNDKDVYLSKSLKLSPDIRSISFPSGSIPARTGLPFTVNWNW